MRLIDYLDKGASLGEDAPCFTTGDASLSYAEVQRHTHRVARALRRAGIAPGDKVAVLSGNDPIAFACVFGISRAAAVWCPINPRNEAEENRYILDAFDCRALIFHSAYEELVQRMVRDLPKLSILVCLDRTSPAAPSLDSWLEGAADDPIDVAPLDDIAMIAGTGGTTGQPKGVMLSCRNLEAMSALTLMSYPFEGRPVYLALAPLTHAAGVLCLPIMTLGGSIVIMPKADLGEFLRLVGQRQVTHTFLPPTLIYMLLEHPALPATDLSSLQCFWYGAAPMSASRLEDALTKIGPVMGQLFGQTEAPMMISTMAPKDHFNLDGSIARARLSSAGRPTPLVQVGIMDENGRLLRQGERGEIVIRSSLAMEGYYKNADATDEVSRFGWRHTGDIGYLGDENYLFIVDRAKDMIITGGFNVYSIEVENALRQHPEVMDCAVFGLPDDKWGERVSAVVQLRTGYTVKPDDLIAFVKTRIGSLKAPKEVAVWSELPRSKVGKVLKREIRAQLVGQSQPLDSAPQRA
jgi:acyl-CoA synthetase (AMP-forming)/AMP-acid ligase II